MNKLLNAINELGKYYPKLKEVQINNWVKSQEVKYEDGVIYGNTIPNILYYLVNYVCNNKVEIVDNFDMYATMIDFSRNAVFKVDYFKSVIRKQALLGINTILLYTEDTYEVKELEYFGYMRGKYTEEEIKELVEYASIFDIELIPCIQTLGHMAQFLRWGSSLPHKDQLSVLMPNTDATLQIIEYMIQACRRMYKTDKIHIGLDEAFGFGLGNYLKHNGYEQQYQLFVKHLSKVNEICLRNGFKDVYIWSDMFFRMANSGDDYYNFSNSEAMNEIIKDIPANVELVYWDYYNKKYEVYDNMIKKHQSFDRGVGMASGTWIWTKLIYDRTQTMDTALHAIEACKNNKVRDFMYTQWMDDGAPCEYESCFLGLFELSYPALTNGSECKHEVFDFIMNEKYEDHLENTKINSTAMMSLGILWDDILNGIFLNNEGINADCFSKSLEVLNNLIKAKKESDQNVFVNKHTLLLANALKLKLECRIELLDAYFNTKDFSKVLQLADQTKEALYLVKNSFRAMWMERYKPFGYDVMASRLISLIDRYDELKVRIQEYVDGKINKIDELEEKAKTYQYNRFNHQDIFFSTVHVLGY